MADKRPRSTRPRKRGGKNRLADVAAVQRHQQSVLELQQVLQSEVDALVASTRQEVVDAIRSRATRLAQQRSAGDVSTVVEAALDEIFGLGPLEPLLRDPEVRTIELDGAALSANGEPAPPGFRDAAHARGVFDRILTAVGEDLEASPDGVSATLVDGSTVAVRLEDDTLRAVITRP